MDINAAKRLKLSGLPIKYNHDKKGMTLGRVLVAWHDHDYRSVNGYPFAIAFLAVIDNESFLRSPGQMIILSEFSASLSSLKHDMSIAVEISLCHCGARDGCIGTFVTGSRVISMASAFGYPDYKRIDACYNRKPKFMSQDTFTSREFEKTMSELSEKDFQVIKERLSETQASLDNVCKEHENAKDILNLVSQWMKDVITERVTMENNSDCEMAVKRRNDLEMLRKRGILDKGKTDLESLRKLMEFSRECFSQNPESRKMADAVMETLTLTFLNL